jgi:GNAT superfamily N-acetyltransferase
MNGSRVAHREDIPTLVRLMGEFYEEAGFPLPIGPATRAFTQLLDNPQLGASLLLEDGGEVVGYLVVTFGFSMEFGGLRAFVDDFFVRPSSRGKGIGADALKTVRMECLDRGIHALLVEAGPEEHLARRLYARAGFAASGRVLLTQTLAPALHER